MSERPTTSPECAAALGRPPDLAMHIRAVHDKRRDHVCPHCPAAFGWPENLAGYIRTVHEKRACVSIPMSL